MIAATLREARATDARFLSDMLVEAANWHPTRIRPRVQVLADPGRRRYIEGWGRPGDDGVIAEDENGSPVGACWFRVFPPDAAGLGFVAHNVPELVLGVVGIWRAQGIGRQLLRAAIGRATAAGYQRISLSVERGNFAQRLYVSEGFGVVEVRGDSEVMTRSLR